MGVAMTTGTLVYALQDEIDATQATGKRHFVKSSRWEVVSCPTYGSMRGTWLQSAEAKKMLALGDFYEDGSCLRIYPDEVLVYVKGKKLFLDKACNVSYDRL